MSAESSVASRRARSCILTVLLTTLAVPAVGALTASPAAAAPYGQLVIDEAARHYGAPYSWGATGPSTFDCSGFVGFVYRQFGVNLPRTSSEQYNAVQHVPQDQKQVGDLIFTYDAGGIYHVGIYAGGNTSWAATHTGDVVRPQPLWTSSYLVGRPMPGGLIGEHWQALGGERSVLGQATNTEYGVPAARKVDFQGGDIYWSPATGAREVHGAIGALYDGIGGTASVVGLPVSDELAVPGGRANRFTGGTVYWGPWTGAQEVHGDIARKHDALGGAAGPLGLPTSSEIPVTGGRANRFAQGTVYWGPGIGAYEVHGALYTAYKELGGSGGRLGLPVSDERAAPGGRESAFQHGVLRWNASTGKVALVR